MERLKNELRGKLNAMSKEKLVDIIADLSQRMYLQAQQVDL